MVKLSIRFTSYNFLLSLLLFSASCQKKVVLQAEEALPAESPLEEPCPGCEFPDSLWPQNTAPVQLLFRLHLDSNLASPYILQPGHAAQSPTVLALALEQIELLSEASTLAGKGVMLYTAPQTSCAGAQYYLPTNYCKLHLIGDSEIVFSLALNAVPPGTYKWLRLSVAYSEMKIVSRSTSSGNGPSTFAGFYGESVYLTKIKTQNSVLFPKTTVPKQRRYYMFYQEVFGQALQLEGYAPRQSIFNENPMPTYNNNIYVEFTDLSGNTAKPLLVTGNETTNLEVQLIFGTDKLFEWQEKTADGIFQPEIGETVYDFGFRNLKARH